MTEHTETKPLNESASRMIRSFAVSDDFWDTHATAVDLAEHAQTHANRALDEQQAAAALLLGFAASAIGSVRAAERHLCQPACWSDLTSAVADAHRTDTRHRLTAPPTARLWRHLRDAISVPKHTEALTGAIDRANRGIASRVGAPTGTERRPRGLSAQRRTQFTAGDGTWIKGCGGADPYRAAASTHATATQAAHDGSPSNNSTRCRDTADAVDDAGRSATGPAADPHRHGACDG